MLADLLACMVAWPPSWPHAARMATWIAVIGEKGGGGKTTTAVHLARWLDRRGARVLVVDADATQLSATDWLREAAPAVRVVPAGVADEVLETEPGDAEFVVIDGPGGLSEVSRAALLVADLAIVPVAGSALDFRTAAKTARAIKNTQTIRHDLPRALVVLNRLQLHTRIGRETVEDAHVLGLPVARSVIRQRSAIADAPGQGTTVFDAGSAARDAAQDFDALFEEAIGGNATTTG